MKYNLISILSLIFSLNSAVGVESVGVQQSQFGDKHKEWENNDRKQSKDQFYNFKGLSSEEVSFSFQSMLLLTLESLVSSLTILLCKS